MRLQIRVRIERCRMDASSIYILSQTLEFTEVTVKIKIFGSCSVVNCIQMAEMLSTGLVSF